MEQMTGDEVARVFRQLCPRDGPHQVEYELGSNQIGEQAGSDFRHSKRAFECKADLKGYVNVSEAYMRLNTISFTVHKNALPTDVRKRLGFEGGDVMIQNGSQPAPAGSRTPPANTFTPGSIKKENGRLTPQLRKDKAAPTAPGGGSNN